LACPALIEPIPANILKRSGMNTLASRTRIKIPTMLIGFSSESVAESFDDLCHICDRPLDFVVCRISPQAES
jgi:hypothetical protein